MKIVAGKTLHFLYTDAPCSIPRGGFVVQLLYIVSTGVGMCGGLGLQLYGKTHKLCTKLGW
jgi:hypothetical protein